MKSTFWRNAIFFMVFYFAVVSVVAYTINTMIERKCGGNAARCIGQGVGETYRDFKTGLDGGQNENGK